MTPDLTPGLTPGLTPDFTPDLPAGDFTIAADDPCLDGHFPGNPLVPGVVLLDRALEAIRTRLALGPPLLLASVKFTAPVTPGQQVEIFYRPAGGRTAFTCRVGGTAVAAGTASFGP